MNIQRMMMIIINNSYGLQHHFLKKELLGMCRFEVSLRIQITCSDSGKFCQPGIIIVQDKASISHKASKMGSFCKTCHEHVSKMYCPVPSLQERTRGPAGGQVFRQLTVSSGRSFGIHLSIGARGMLFPRRPEPRAKPKVSLAISAPQATHANELYSGAPSWAWQKMLSPLHHRS